MGEYVVGSTEMTLENRDFLRSVSIDADDGMAMFDSITSAFRFCFSLGISLNAGRAKEDDQCRTGNSFQRITSIHYYYFQD